MIKILHAFMHIHIHIAMCPTCAQPSRYTTMNQLLGMPEQALGGIPLEALGLFVR